MRVIIITPVAAAASVPSSFTSTTALCKTLDINKPEGSVLMPEKSAFDWSKANGAPNTLR